MANIKPRVILPLPRDNYDKQFQEALSRFLEELVDIINQGLKFSDNFDAQIIDYTTNAVADTEDTVAHTLKRIPTGFLLLNTDKAASLYDSGTSWTDTNMYLKCDVTSAAVKILVF